MPRDDKIHVLVAHMNPLVSAGLVAAMAAQDGFQLIAESDADTARRASAIVAVTDSEAGIRLMGSKRGGPCRVLILTDDESEITIRRAVELGVRGYLPLSSGVESVVRAVRCIHGGGTALAPFVMTRMSENLSSRGLSSREVEVLRMLMEGLPDKAIARRLHRSLWTAKSHVKAILLKLQVSSRVEAIAVARRRGLVHEEAATTQRECAAAHDLRELTWAPEDVTARSA
jgi:DNA-binding NarL/FixJ family response regulator